MASTASWIAILITAICGVWATSDSSGLEAVIPDNLLECYRNASLLTRENLPPMTLNVLLSIIRKLENLSGTYLDMRTMSSQILNTYRMDGIEKNPDVAATAYVTPYGPSGNQFYRYKILMDGLIPSSGGTFSNYSLRPQEKCAFHIMLSLSVDRTERGDESTTCNSLTNYVRWDSRVPRYSGRNIRDVKAYQEEVEMLENPNMRGSENSRWLEGGYTGLSCPLENGVVYTRFGAVKMGLILGGIAAGLQSQSVSRRNLILVAKANSLRGQPYNIPRLYSSSDTTNISNIWAATLSGEIAEVALLQGPLSSSQMRVGLNGGWNDSVLPRYYFLQEDNKDAMTNTDIRGSIDGLTMGTQAQNWTTQVGSSTLKLSQLLDMYYSERGVLKTGIRACQRLTQFTSMFTSDQVLQQSYAFSGVLELELPPAVSVSDVGLMNFNTIATQKLVTTMASMTDNKCSFTASTYSSTTSSSQITYIVNPAVHLYIALDFTYDFIVASRIVSQLAERLEVSRFTGNVSVINAKDATVVVNSTSDILDLYANFTRTNYSNGQRGFDLARVVRDVGTLLRARLDKDKVLGTAGGPASVVLVVPSSSGSVSDNDKDYINNRLSDLRNTIPDTRFMFLTPGSTAKFTPFVQNKSDVFTLTLSDIPTSIDAVITRFKQIPRRIINPTCGSFNGTTYGTTSALTYRTYIEPVGGVQYFRIHPNYFYNSGSCTITISSSSGMTLNICQSRVNVLPGNSSTSDSCRQVTTDSYVITLNSACGDSSVTNCSPMYFSIAVVATTSTTITACTDDGCRYPDNIAVDIRQDGLTCSSDSAALRALALPLLAALTLLALSRSHLQPSSVSVS